MPKHKPVNDAPEWAANLARRERRFGEEYIIDLNASAALRRSGACSTKNPDVDAYAILRRRNVAEAVLALVAERSGATQSRILEELRKIAFVGTHDIAFVKDGQVIARDTDELTPDQRAVVAGYETNKKGYVTVKLHDKVRALDLLSKVLGMKRSVNAEAPSTTVNVAIQDNAGDARCARPRAGVRPDQAGPRVPPVPDARLRQGARRVGHRLHRPQSAQARTQVDSVRSMPNGRRRRLTMPDKGKGVTKPSQAVANPIKSSA